MIQKSYSKTEGGNLYIVPTPIGNIKDITSRAVSIFKEVDLIYAEDTRTSSVLMKMLDIKKPMKACHLHNESSVKFSIVSELKQGKNIALISDQGTPLLSDPGYEVVTEVINHGINVIALPGPSALLPALNMSGLEANKFLFYGFLNSKSSAARKELELLKDLEFTLVFYESPHRFLNTMENILDIMGDRKVGVSREITKMYEEVFRGTVSECIKTYKTIKGEIVIVLEKGKKEVDMNSIMLELEKAKKSGLSNKDAVKFISEKYKISKNMLYNKNEETNR